MYCFPWGERRITQGGLINGFNKWAIWIFLTQVKEKHNFSSALDENTKRSQTLILKFQSAAEMKGPITASVAPPSPVPPEERLLLFELPQKKKKRKVGLHQQQGRQANMLDATLISRLLKNSIF